MHGCRLGRIFFYDHLFYLNSTDITIRIEDAESLSASGTRDVESERFLCTASSGRRVSFNEGALCGQEKRERDRGRR